jgi:hypothetical protein
MQSNREPSEQEFFGDSVGRAQQIGWNSLLQSSNKDVELAALLAA